MTLLRSTAVALGSAALLVAVPPAAAEGLPEGSPSGDDSGEPPRVTAPGMPPLLGIVWVVGAAPAAPPVSAVEAAPEAVPAPVETIGSETIEIVDRPPPGAAAEVGEEALERAEQDDIHKVLAQVAGVYLRDEDGYGLRPNIGMRGAAAERSAKVALMEDGVLIAPAPYSAPAAYYFPLTTRMSGVEVIKGPAAIEYGPNTVGGAVNMLGAPMPRQRSGYLDVALGSDLYGKVHARAAEGGERWGVMAEYVKLRSDGFKELDGGGGTGFDKNDAQLSARLSSPATASAYHDIELRVGYADEDSDETYTGLTDADFAAAPQRRYVATRDDHMTWHHWRFRAAHRFELGTRLRVATTAYRHQFDRAWAKVDGFVGQKDLYRVIASPMAGVNRIYYAVLTGAADSSSPEDQLIRGTNDRQFVSQGVQSQARLRGSLGPVDHQLDAGIRVHHDGADRKRFEDAYRMVDGGLVRSDRPRATTVDTLADTLAISVHAQDRLTWRRLEVVAGARLEVIDFDFEDRIRDVRNDGTYPVIIPGGGAQYHVTDDVSVLAGVHRGFVPVAPSASDDVDPESSINYEAGVRWSSARVRADLLGFFNDYSNLKGTCTNSTGCVTADDGKEFNGGRVHIWGVEASAAGDVPVSAGLRVPLQAAYTLTRSAFQSSFTSSFSGWGDVMEGDELPYLPVHQLFLGAALAASRWELGSSLRWRSEARDQAGQGSIPDLETIDALLVVDLTAHVRLGAWGELYGTCDNLLDEQVIVSRRPYGARPNSPRLFVLGYKARF